MSKENISNFEKETNKLIEDKKNFFNDLLIVFKHAFFYPLLYLLIILFSIKYFEIDLLLIYLFVILLNILLIHNVFSFPSEYRVFKNHKNYFIYKNSFYILYSIIIYSIIYYNYWSFNINWEFKNITWLESLYLSISMWINLWYSYILPNKEIALLTTLEAINWYFYFAFILAILAVWINNSIKKNK